VLTEPGVAAMGDGTPFCVGVDWEKPLTGDWARGLLFELWPFC